MGNAVGVLSCNGTATAAATHSPTSLRRHRRGAERKNLSRASSNSSFSSNSSSSSASSSTGRSSRRPASMEILPASDDGVTRVKVILSKADVDDMLAHDSVGSDFFDNLLTTCVRHKVQQQEKQLLQQR